MSSMNFNRVYYYMQSICLEDLQCHLEPPHAAMYGCHEYARREMQAGRPLYSGPLLSECCAALGEWAVTVRDYGTRPIGVQL